VRGQLLHHVRRQTELLAREHEHEHPHVFFEHERVGPGRVVDREITGLEHGFAAVLDQQAGARDLEARLVEARVAVGDQRLGALNGVR
jgi:hypothetical protein